MKVTHKTLGLSMIALAAGLFATATIAENMPGMMDGMRGDGMGVMSADADKDGKITKDEFEAWRTTRVTSADTDKDGKLSVDELAAMRVKQVEAGAKTMAERMVSMHDTDGDGKLSAEELVTAPTPGFDALDTNGDGTVDATELQAFRTAHGGDDQGRMGGKHGRHGRHGQDMQDPAAN